MSRTSQNWITRVKPYIGALIACLVALTLTRSIPIVRANAPIAFFFGAVAVSARIGGWGPALLATGTSALLTEFFILPHATGVAFGLRESGILSVFVLISSIISTTVDAKAKAERRAIHSRDRLVNMIEASSDAIITSNFDGVFTSWNAAAERIYGYTREEAIGQKSSLIVPPAKMAEAQSEIEAIRRGESVPSHETYRVAKDGSRRWVSVSVSPVFDEKGELSGLLRIVRDLTAQKVSDEANLNVWRLATQAGSVIAWRWHAEDEHTQYWGEVEPVLGAEIQGVQQAIRHIHPDDRSRFIEAWKSALEKNSLYDVEFRWLRNNEWIWLYSRGSAVRNVAGVPTGMVGVSIDVTERKRAERALRDTEKLATAGRLAASVAHEINNPLEAVTNLLYLAAHDESTNGHVKSYLRAAEDELKRIAHITQQTLGFYRESRTQTRMDLAAAVAQVVSLYARKAQAKEIRLLWQSKGPVTVKALEGELRQVIANLVSNAIQAVDVQGKIVVRTNTADRGGIRGARITVADTGGGIPEESSQRIWEPFYTTKSEIGTGLGLWVTRQIVERHGGNIRFRSRTGTQSGTVFQVFIPAGCCEPEPVAN